MEEMKKAQERLEKQTKESEELPLEDGGVESKAEGEKRQEIEDDPKRASEQPDESEGKSIQLPPKSSPVALTPAKPGTAVSGSPAVSRTTGQRRDETPGALEDESGDKVEESRTSPSGTVQGRVGLRA